MSVPEDVSVTGFDDVPEASTSTPRLTTVRRDHTRVGTASAKFIIDRITGKAPDEPRLLELSPELVLRDSTAPPRISA